MAKKRKLTRRNQTDWKKLIKLCLHKSVHTDRWGCLNSKGKLFRIATLGSTQVPMHIVKEMENSGIIQLGEKLGQRDMYNYIPKKERRKETKIRKRRKLL